MLLGLNQLLIQKYLIQVVAYDNVTNYRFTPNVAGKYIL
jgi:hypothetical protein